MKLAYDWYDNMTYIVPERNSKEARSERIKLYGMIGFVIIFGIALYFSL